MKALLLAFCLLLNPLYASMMCKGIVLLGEDSLLNSLEEGDVGISVYNLEIPGSDSGSRGILEKRLASAFLEQEITPSLLTDVRDTIQQFYTQQNHPLVEVVVPEQELTHGIIQVKVLESRIAQVKVEGNPRSPSKRLKNYLGVSKHDAIDTFKLNHRLEFLNRNPSRHVDLVYSPGSDAYTTDISLVVEETRPVKFYVGADNIGVQTTGRGLCFSGVKCDRMFSLDHFFSYQYTTSQDFEKFQAHNVQYTAYLPWLNILSVYGGYSAVHAHLPQPSTTNHGHSYQASTRYLIPIATTSSFSHEIGFGFDFKRTNNTVEYSEVYPVISSNVNLSQFAFRYESRLASKQYDVGIEGELFVSPGEIMADQTDAAYASLRPDAKSQWIYGKALVSYRQQLPAQFAFFCKARGQLTSQNLLPSEQIGLGGFDSVRGYDERQLNYDHGVIINSEILAPALPFFSFWKQKKGWHDSLQLLAFLDYGFGGNHTLIPGEKKWDYLVGIGPAARYTFNTWLSARLDLGIKLRREEIFSGGNRMLYFSVVGNY